MDLIINSELLNSINMRDFLRLIDIGVQRNISSDVDNIKELEEKSLKLRQVISSAELSEEHKNAIVDFYEKFFFFFMGRFCEAPMLTRLSRRSMSVRPGRFLESGLL